MSIQYNVATLLQEPIGSIREYDIDSDVVLDDDLVRHHVTGEASLLRTKDGVLVQAKLRSTERDDCSRCLRAVDVPIELELEEEFYPTVDLVSGGRAAEPQDSEALRIDAHHVLDLSEALRQTWATEEPMQPLCRPDCRGLCATCGADLNEQTCECKPETDQRWSALQRLVLEPEGR
jgi:uncharacterized protein